MKECSKCRETLPLSSFTKSTSSAQGYYSQCRACKRKTARLSYRRLGRPDRRLTRRQIRNRTEVHHDPMPTFTAKERARWRRNELRLRARLDARCVVARAA